MILAFFGEFNFHSIKRNGVSSMTADKYLTYWCSNDDWWDYDENGKPVILPTAPEEAQKSYRYYLEHNSEETA